MRTARHATESTQGVQRYGPPVSGPLDDALLSPREVAAWLVVDERWVARAIARDDLPVMGYRSCGTPVVSAGEVRAWLRRPDPLGDET